MSDSEYEFMRLAAAGRYVKQKTGKRPRPQTLHRWVQRGLAGIKLQTTYIGGYRHVTEFMVDQFFSAVTAAKNGRSDPIPPPDTAGESSRADKIAEAERELEDIDPADQPSDDDDPESSDIC